MDRAQLVDDTALAENLYQIMFDASPLPMWVLDAETLRYLAVNEAMTAAHGFTRDEMLALTLADLKPADEIDQTRRSVASARPGEIRKIGVRRERHKDGSIIELDVTNHPLIMNDRLVLLCTGVDVTETHRLEEQLRQSQKMEAVGQLAGGVAHDFNNILAVIISNVDMALEAIGTSHAAAIDLQDIAAAAQRAAALTRQLLAFSRKQPREPKPIALNAIVTGLEAMMCRLVGEDIAMSAHLAPQLGTIEADANQLEQVLINLIVNARDAMPRGGSLSITTSNTELGDIAAAELGVGPGRYVMLAVTDSGSGIAPAVQARMFEPFFTTKEVGKGTGLGLATVFGIVKQSGGGIAVESVVGHGATFRVFLPQLDRPVVATEVPVAPQPARGSETILLVEDDPALRRVLRRQLGAWGYDVVEAEDARAALARADEQPIDLLLTDVVMPGVDGRTLATQLVGRQPETRVVFMSGHTEHSAIKTVAFTAVDHFVQKPFSPVALSHAIRRALDC